MGILAQCDNISGSTLSKSIIPDYARDYKNEYLFIRGIDNTCGEFVKTIKENEEFYNSPKALRIIRKIKRLGCFNKISRIRFDIDDVENIEFIKSAIEEYRDLYCDPYTGYLNEELYNIEAEIDNPGFKSFYKHFSKFYNKYNTILSKSKIPDYARNEYLLIRGINKKL